MANTVNVNQNNNVVTLDDQNRNIKVTNNKTNNTVKVSQPVTRVVTVSSVGIRGPQGPQGETGATGERGLSTTQSLHWENIQGAPNVVDFTGNIVPNQLAIFADTFTGTLPTNLPFSLPLEPEGDGVPTIQGLSGLTYNGSVFEVSGNINTTGVIYASQIELDYDNLPTSSVGLAKGRLWRDGDYLKISRG